MPGRLGPRFAIEAGFLILLAVAAGLADLSWQAIVLVMAAAWVLVAILEWAMWREGPRLPRPVPPSYATWSAEEAAPITPEPVLPPVEEATGITRRKDSVKEPEPEEPEALEEPEEEAPPRRRWRRRRRPEEEESVPEPLPQPKHVRLLPRTGESDEGE